MWSSIARIGRKLRFRHWNFANRLIVAVLFFTLVPLFLFTSFSLHLFRQNYVNSVELQLRQTTKSLIMLCEAQEALDRLRKQPAQTPATDAVSSASPSWIDGNEYKSLQSVIMGMKVAVTGFAYVFDSTGLLVVHPTDAGQNVFAQTTRSNLGYLEKIRRRALQLPVGVIETIRYDYVDPAEPKSRPRTRLESFGYFQPYDWIIVVGCYEDELIEAYAKGRRVMYVTLLLVTLAVGVLVFVFSQRMMRPIARLTQAATRITHGDLRPVKPLGASDEIGKLTGEFNVMIQHLQDERIHKLEEWTKELEKNVEERTADLERAYAQLVTIEKLASLGKISAMVAHELNNPMSGILSYSMYCERVVNDLPWSEDFRKELRECLKMISMEAERCGTIVNNLLMFAKRSYGDFKPARLHQIIDQGLMVIDHSLKVHEIVLAKRLAAADDLLWCDPSGLEQMVIALTINAVEAMDKGGRITLATRGEDDESLIVEVSDTGKGIPQELLPRVFEPFVSDKDGNNSVGLGLSVVYGIVQSHGGEIRVDSKVGLGTTFVVTLPRRRDKLGRVEEGDRRETPRAVDAGG
jgi:signal transduction histidine kinase